MKRRYTRGKRTEEQDSSKRRDLRISNGISIGIGCSLVIATLGLCIVGTNRAMSSMQRQMNEVLTQAEQSISDMDASDALNSGTNVSDSSIVPSDDNWTSEQIEWMRKYHVTYYNGKPYDEFGHVVDDPTTAENEAESGNFKDSVLTDDESGSKKPVKAKDDSSSVHKKLNKKQNKSSKKEPEISHPWYEGNSDINLTKKGKPYYIVKKGDCLSKIAKKTGFTERELVARNNIKNKNLIYIGDRIYFPNKDANVNTGVDLHKGLG